MPDERAVIDQRFWQWMKDTHSVSKQDVAHLQFTQNFDITPYWNYFWAKELSEVERKEVLGETPVERFGEEGVRMLGPLADLTDKEMAAWREYQAAGGTQDTSTWVIGGGISITEEAAAYSWLARLGEYLDVQLQQGFKDKAEVDVIYNDMENRLLGQGKYKGKRQTVAEISGTLVTSVNNWWSGLPKAQQAEIDQQNIAVVQQQQYLPLGGGGTHEQQINTAYSAIRDLTSKKSLTNDLRLRDTIDQQIGELQGFISQTNRTIGTMAGIRTEASQPKNVQDARYYERGTAPALIAQKYGGSPDAAMQTVIRYEQNPQAPEFANLSKEERSQLTAGATEYKASGAAPVQPLPPVEPPQFRELGISGSPTWRSWFQQQYPSIASQFMGKPEGERTQKGWAGFLEKEKARIREEFAKQGAYYRGERPSVYAPRIKTAVF